MKFKKQKDHWKELLPCEKLFAVAGFVCFVAFVVFAVLELLDRFGILSLGFEPFAWIVRLFLAWRTCDLLVQWRKKDELDELDLKYALFCFIFLGGLFAILAMIALFVNL